MKAAPFASSRSRRQLAWVAVAAIWSMLAVMACQAGLIADEWIHFPQVSRMRAGDWSADPSLTMPPGFHGLVALAMKLAGADSLGAARWIAALSGLAGVGLFHAVRRELAHELPTLSTQQFALLPPLLPFVFLVYTDVLSLTMVLGAWWLGLRKHHLPAAAVLLASLLVRQNNVIWAGFVAAWALWEAVGWQPWRDWRATARIASPYLAVATAFAAYVAVHGRISMSEAQSHAHSLSFHVGNLYFALGLLAALIPLHLLAGARRFWAKARVQPLWWLLPVASLALFSALFAVDHPYNRAVPHYNVRNAALLYIEAHPFAKAFFGMVTTLAACGLAGNGTVVRQGWLLLPFAALALCTAWLIEPRYSLVPLALYLALRRRESAPVEWITLALWAALAVYFATGVFDYRFMI